MREKIGRFLRKIGRRNRADWPVIEQGQYRTYRAVHPFDEQFGVDTSGLIYDLASGHPHDVYNNGYFAVAPSVFHGVMNALHERLGLECEGVTFVDVGSGKGRALLLASDYPFREVIGVEISPELNRIARSNITRYVEASLNVRPPMASINADATAFPWPPGPLLVYMWNAFEEPVMRQVFDNLRASLLDRPRPLYLVYMHPELESTLAGMPWLDLLWREEFALSDEDYAAWAFPPRVEVCAVYAGVASGLQTKV
jgi:SAM-dependent methyltransferase